jgi:scyllo-inositol 2-dehydrogenase (NADP+)
MTDNPLAADARVRVGIAGLGRSGWGLHAATVAKLSNLFRLTGVADPLEERLKEAADAYGCATYSTVAELAQAPDVDLLVVATPSHLHAAHAITALEGGKHVLVEKPHSMTVAEADEMIAAAGEAERYLISSQNLRFTADFLKAQEIIASGRLGRIIQINIRRHAFRRRWDWQTLTKFGGGMLYNDASHIVDQALLLLGDGEVDVTCSLARTPLTQGDAEDHVKIILSKPGGPLVDLEFSNACAYPQEQWLVFGTHGTLTGGPSHLRWRYIDPSQVEERRLNEEPTSDRGYNAEDLPWIEEECRFPQETYTSSHVRLYRRLYDSIAFGPPPAVHFDGVRRQIGILERCRAATIEQFGGSIS